MMSSRENRYMKKNIYLYYLPFNQDEDEDLAIVKAENKGEARKIFQRFYSPGTEEFIYNLGVEKMCYCRSKGRLKILSSNPEDRKTKEESDKYIISIRKRRLRIYAICWILSVIGLITVNFLLGWRPKEGL